MTKTNKQFWEDFSGEYEKLVGETGDENHESDITPTFLILKLRKLNI